MKVFIGFVLLLSLAVMASAKPKSAVDEGRISSENCTKSGTLSDGHRMLDVERLSQQESRMTYEEIGKLLTGSSEVAEGITTFDGKGITVKIPPQTAVADAAPVIISTNDCSMPSLHVAYPVVTKRVPPSSDRWQSAGARPIVQHESIGRPRNTSVTQAGSSHPKVSSSPARTISTGGRTTAAFGSHRR